MLEIASGRHFKCDQCDYQSNRSYDLRRHKQRHTRVKPIEGLAHKCTKCEFITKWKRNMKRHMQIHKNEEEQVIEEYIYEVLDGTESDPDNQVEQVLSISEAEPDNHVEEVIETLDSDPNNHVEETLEFDPDNHEMKVLDTFKTEPDELVEETQAEFLTDSAPEQTNNPRIFRCDQCHYTTKRTFDLRRHKQTHSRAKVFESGCHKCQKCSFVTKWKRNMTRHMKKHEKSTVEEEDELHEFGHSTYGYTVELKDADQTYMFSFSKSVNSQTLEKAYKCWHCDYETKRAFDLRRHSLRHARAKPIKGIAYQCNDCSFLTKWSHNIRRHMEHRHNKFAMGDASDEMLFNKVFIDIKSDEELCEENNEALEAEEEKTQEVLPSLWIALPSKEA